MPYKERPYSEVWVYLDTLSFLDNFKATVGSIEEVVAEVLLDYSTTSVDDSARKESSRDDYAPDEDARSVFLDVGPSGSRIGRKPTKRQADADVSTAFREFMHEYAGTLKEIGKTPCPENDDDDATTSLFELSEARNMTDDDAALTHFQNTVTQVTPDKEENFYEHLLKVLGIVVLYLHGNTGSRGAGHRVDMFCYHLLTLGYRGYGNSDQVSPTEKGVVRDAIAV